MSGTRYKRFYSWHFGLCSSHTLGRRCLLLGILRPIHDPKGTAVKTAMVTLDRTLWESPRREARRDSVKCFLCKFEGLSLVPRIYVKIQASIVVCIYAGEAETGGFLGFTGKSAQPTRRVLSP